MSKVVITFNSQADASVAFLLLDVLNEFDFPEGEKLLQEALPMARRIAQLKKRLKAERVPVIYCNDNFGRWRSDLRSILEHCLREECPGREIAEILKPEEDDYFVLKPKHSGFFQTTLETLLKYLGVKTLILSGVAGNICVLFTANDAHMLDYRLMVPSDCIASNTKRANDFALWQLNEVLGADVRPSQELELKRKGA